MLLIGWGAVGKPAVEQYFAGGALVGDQLSGYGGRHGRVISLSGPLEVGAGIGAWQAIAARRVAVVVGEKIDDEQTPVAIQ